MEQVSHPGWELFSEALLELYRPVPRELFGRRVAAALHVLSSGTAKELITEEERELLQAIASSHIQPARMKAEELTRLGAQRN